MAKFLALILCLFLAGCTRAQQAHNAVQTAAESTEAADRQLAYAAEKIATGETEEATKSIEAARYLLRGNMQMLEALSAWMAEALERSGEQVLARIRLPEKLTPEQAKTFVETVAPKVADATVKEADENASAPSASGFIGAIAKFTAPMTGGWGVLLGTLLPVAIAGVAAVRERRNKRALVEAVSTGDQLAAATTPEAIKEVKLAAAKRQASNGTFDLIVDALNTLRKGKP